MHGNRLHSSRRCVRFALLAAIALVLLMCSAGAAAPRPNIIFIFADDLGWADLGCYGSTFYETPHLDRLAAQGMRFTQAYAAAPVCSPTRAAAMTGKLPARVGITEWIPGRRSGRMQSAPYLHELPHEEVTMAEALREGGYATAFIGKWHLGGTNYWPRHHGFDVNLGGCEKGSPPSYFSTYKLPTLSDGPPGEYLTDRLTDETIRFINAHTNQPFFIALWHYAVHNPQQAKPELIEKYRRKAATLGTNAEPFRAEGDFKDRRVQEMPVYAAMIESLDESVGRIVRRLDEIGLGEQTLIVFTSDNGGLSTSEGSPTSNHPLRTGKGWLYEGGIREPFIVRWPAAVPAGRVSHQPVITTDLYPTFLEAADLPLRPEQHRDGLSLMPLLRENATLPERLFFWHYPHYSNQGSPPVSAVRKGDLKLIEFLEDGHCEMYDVVRDVGETNNLANQQPGKANELGRWLAEWRTSVNGRMPEANPNFRFATEKQPAYIVQAEGDGSLWLHARTADIHGTTVRYEPQPNKNTLGYWTHSEDWVSWTFVVRQPGEYRVEILQGCGPGNGGSEVDFLVGEQRISIHATETKGFQDFLARDIGTVQFSAPGRYTLAVKPRNKTRTAVMDLRSVTLRPIPAGAAPR